MKTETAELLIAAVQTATEIAIDNRSKIMALEILLKRDNEILFQDYSETLEKVRNNPPTSLFPGQFSKLQSKLAQD